MRPRSLSSSTVTRRLVSRCQFYFFNSRANSHGRHRQGGDEVALKAANDASENKSLKTTWDFAHAKSNEIMVGTLAGLAATLSFPELQGFKA